MVQAWNWVKTGKNIGKHISVNISYIGKHCLPILSGKHFLLFEMFTDTQNVYHYTKCLPIQKISKCLPLYKMFTNIQNVYRYTKCLPIQKISKCLPIHKMFTDIQNVYRYGKNKNVYRYMKCLPIYKMFTDTKKWTT